MNIGMLWINENKDKTPEENLNTASAYYFKKYGIHANVCHLHPTEFPETKEVAEKLGITLIPDGYILKRLFWLGVEKGEDE